MFVRPWLLLYRNRLIASAASAVLAAVFTLFITSAESPLDFGILWHHFCGCPLDSMDARLVSLPFSFGALAIPAILGLSAIANRPGAPQGFTLFQMTRPVPRRRLLLAPLGIASLAIAFLPPLGWGLLLGWLKLVHAPSLGHLLGAAEMLPRAAGLGPHPPFLQLMAAMQMGRRWLAAWSVGMCVYAIYASQRWLLLSSSGRLRTLGVMAGLLPALLPVLVLMNKRALSAVLLLPPSGSPLGYAPSTLGIMLHFTVAATVLWGSWEALRRAEL